VDFPGFPRTNNRGVQFGAGNPNLGRIDMGSHISVHGYGKLSIAPDAKAPLLVVFGGITVDNVQSGVYMWKYMKGVEDRFHIFVAVSNDVHGDKAYDSLMKIVKEHGLAPPTQILYLFSGGYGPGMPLLRDNGSDRFSSIYLVDIWMGIGKNSHSLVPDFYKVLVNKLPEKITYVYTSFGANNPAVRDYIAGKLGAQKAKLVPGSGMDTHMSTNTVAVSMLP
jgi:hypothetical protein